MRNTPIQLYSLKSSDLGKKRACPECNTEENEVETWLIIHSDHAWTEYCPRCKSINPLKHEWRIKEWKEKEKEKEENQQ